MPSFHESRLVRHAAADMFELVADFERYPEFAPFCLAARIRKRWSEPSGVEILIADMEVGYGSIRSRFATRDRLDRAKGVISIVNLSGPFKHFEIVVVVPGLAERGFAHRVLHALPVFQPRSRVCVRAGFRPRCFRYDAGL